MVTKIVNDTDYDVSYSVKNAFDEAHYNRFIQAATSDIMDGIIEFKD